jgi:hypothetical protein
MFFPYVAIATLNSQRKDSDISETVEYQII